MRSFKEKLIQKVHFDEALLQYGVGESSLHKDKSLKVLVWNTNKLDTKSLLSFLNTCHLNPDLFFLQEVVSMAGTSSPLQEVSSLAWVMAKSIYLPKSQLFSGVKTGSRFLLSSSEIWHSVSDEVLSQTPKAGVHTLHQIQNESAHVLALNVHMLNFAGLNSYIRELDALTLRVSKHEGPVILGGDFNTWSRGRWRALKEWSNSVELDEVNFNGGNAHKWSGLQLDHVFVRHFKVEQAQVFKTKWPSDHWPLWVQLKLS